MSPFSQTLVAKCLLLLWSHQAESNRRLADYESATLPTELWWQAGGLSTAVAKAESIWITVTGPFGERWLTFACT
jgi:hypothetical protein